MREDKVKIKKINSIMFQISAANVAILIAFFLFFRNTGKNKKY